MRLRVPVTLQVTCGWDLQRSPCFQGSVEGRSGCEVGARLKSTFPSPPSFLLLPPPPQTGLTCSPRWPELHFPRARIIQVCPTTPRLYAAGEGPQGLHPARQMLPPLSCADRDPCVSSRLWCWSQIQGPVRAGQACNLHATLQPGALCSQKDPWEMLRPLRTREPRPGRGHQMNHQWKSHDCATKLSLRQPHIDGETGRLQVGLLLRTVLLQPVSAEIPRISCHTGSLPLKYK